MLFDLAAAATNGFPIQWNDDYGARLGVMPRDGSNADVVWYDIDPCYVYHPVNAYEDGDRINVDTKKNTLDLEVSKRELSERRKKWTAPPLKAQRGTLYKYIKNVKTASEGCVTDE